MRGQGAEPGLNRAVDHGAAYGGFDRSRMVDRLRESVMGALQRMEAAAFARRSFTSMRGSAPMSRRRDLATGRTPTGASAGLVCCPEVEGQRLAFAPTQDIMRAQGRQSVYFVRASMRYSSSATGYADWQYPSSRHSLSATATE